MCLDIDIDNIFDSNPEGCCSSRDNNCNLDLCPRYPANHSRAAAVAAVTTFISSGNNNAPFYNAFTGAWEKATRLGWEGQLSPLANICEQETASPTAGPAAAPTDSPVASPTLSPVASPALSPVAGPTLSPVAAPTTCIERGRCDVDSDCCSDNCTGNGRCGRGGGGV